MMRETSLVFLLIASLVISPFSVQFTNAAQDLPVPVSNESDDVVFGDGTATEDATTDGGSDDSTITEPEPIFGDSTSTTETSEEEIEIASSHAEELSDDGTETEIEKPTTITEETDEALESTEVIEEDVTPSKTESTERSSRTSLIQNVHDAEAWRKYHEERTSYLESKGDVPAEVLEKARYAKEKFETELVQKGYIDAPDAEIKESLVSFLLRMFNKVFQSFLTWILPETAYAYLFGQEDFESCGALPCSFDSNVSWGSVTESLDATSKVAGADSLKELVTGEGGGGLKKDNFSTSEIWVQFKVWVPNPVTWGGSGFFTVLMLQDGSDANTVWLNVEDYGNPRLTVVGDVLSYTDTGLDLVEGAVNTIEMRVKIGTSAGDVDIWLNNTTQGSPSYNGSGSMNTGSDNIDAVISGVTYAPENGVSTTYHDNIIVSNAFVGAGGGGNSAPSAPTSLLAEGLTNPTNISDPTPELSAIYNDADTTDVATKYRIQVDNNSDFSSVYWDTGTTTLASSTPQGTRIANISYSGSALASSTTYYWRIKFWDTADAEGAWSTDTSTFSLAASGGGGGGGGEPGGAERVAYYGNWSIYGNDYTFKDADASGAIARLTTLNYAFQNISTSTQECFQAVVPADIDESNPNAGDGAADAWADYQKVFDATMSVDGSADSPTQPLRGNLNQLKQLKQKYPNLKVFVSIGGWTFSKYFSDAAMSTSSRENMVSSCIDMFIKGDMPTGINGDMTAGGTGVAADIFDGIDIDWEYPAAVGHLGNHYDDADTENFTKLLAEFRSQLDAQGAIDDKYYYLTAAVPAGGNNISKIETEEIEPYLDWVGIMTYDMHGAWDPSTNFMAPLFPSANDPASTTALTVVEAAQHWIDGGWSKDKLVIGVPTYWRGWTGVSAGANHGLYQNASGPSQSYTYSVVEGVAQYKELLAAGKFTSANMFYDPITHSPWIYDGTELYSGDTPASIVEKGAWIRDQGFLGAMIYSLESDDTSATLVKALMTGLDGGAPAPIPAPEVEKQLARTSQSSENTAKNGEPINVIGGNYLGTRHELHVPGRDVPVDFILNYNSAAASIPNPVGWGWTHNYRVTAVEDSDGSVLITNPDGRLDRYEPSGGGYDAPDGINDTLASSSGKFILTRKDKTILAFNATGLLGTTTSPNGNTNILTYNATSSLVSLEDSVGRDFTFTYNAFNQLVTVTDPGNREVNYEYDALGNLVSVTNPEGEETSYEYDDNHRITQVTDPRNYDVVTNIYDEEGRVTEQTDGLGKVVTLDYEEGETTYTDARGGETVYSYDGDLRITGIEDALTHSTTFTYDADGNLATTTDALSRATGRSYDSNGNLTRITNALGGNQTFTYDGSDNLLTRSDELGHTTSYQYDVLGNVTRKIDPVYATTTFAYDSYGQLASSTDPRSKVTYFEYDAEGNLITKTDGEDRDTYYDYDDVGRLVNLENATTDEYVYTLDGMDRITNILDPEGGNTVFTYDDGGNKLTATDANSHTTTYAYDANNKLTSVTNALSKVTTYGYDANNNLATTTDAKGHQTAYAYDPLNRQTRVTDPLSNVTQIGYDYVGNVTSRIDASSRTTAYTYDSLNRLATTTYPDSSTIANTYDAAGNITRSVKSGVGTTTYTYDAANRVETVTDPNNNVVTYTYDLAGNLTKVKYPDNKTVTYAYNNANQLATTTDWNTSQTTYTYNANGQLATTTLPNTMNAAYTYDGNGNLESLVWKKNTTAFTRFDYERDNVGNITDDTETKGANEYYTEYTYDALNQLTLADAPSNTYAYYYDDVGNLATTTFDAATTTFAYNAANQLTSQGARNFTYDAQGNQITDASNTLAYNYDNQLTSYVNPGGYSTTTTTHTIYNDSTTWNDWSWDVTNTFNHTTTKYSGTASLRVVYNQAWGGLYLQKSPGITISTSTHLHFAVRSSTSNPTIEIDAYGANDVDIGNLALSTYLPSMSANTWYTVDIPLSALGATSTLTGISAMRSTTGTLYFDEIKLLGVATSTATTTYAYDATGQRIMKGLNATTTYQYVNAGAEQVLVERDMASSTLSTYFVYGTDLVSQGPAATTSRQYFVTDGLGNVRYITNSSGNSMGGYTYQPFGTITTGSATTTTHAFQTEQKDPESNLIYLRARYYDPTTARFTARDPFSGFMVDPASQNGYNYANNNPVNLTDKNGENPLLITGVLGAGAGVVGQYGYDVYNNVQANGLSANAFYSSLSGGNVYLTRAFQGLVVGATGGAAGNLGIAAQVAIGGLASGATGAAGNAALGQPVTAQSVITDTVLGGLTAGLSGAVPKVPGRLPNFGTEAFYRGKHAQYNAQAVGVNATSNYLSQLVGGYDFSGAMCSTGSLR